LRPTQKKSGQSKPCGLLLGRAKPVYFSVG
jgi:hypothetical protein